MKSSTLMKKYVDNDGKSDPTNTNKEAQMDIAFKNDVADNRNIDNVRGIVAWLNDGNWEIEYSDSTNEIDFTASKTIEGAIFEVEIIYDFDVKRIVYISLSSWDLVENYHDELDVLTKLNFQNEYAKRYTSYAMFGGDGFVLLGCSLTVDRDLMIHYHHKSCNFLKEHLPEMLRHIRMDADNIRNDKLDYRW